MTIVLDLKKILVFIKSRARLLVVSGLIGFSLAVTINFISPKLYEAYFEFQLARVLLKAEGLAAKEPHWVTIPQVVDARRILMSPMKISQSVVEACGYMDTNENRKNLINQIQVNALNSAGTEMFVYVRIDGKEAAKKCAEAILAMEITNSNAELDKYIQSASNPIADKKIVKAFPATPSGGIRVSSDYIYPRVFLNLVAYIFIAIFMGLFFDWVYFRLHAAVRG
jgi:uncharacterized protein involved in exopolysaccharide biosynthesis